MRLILVRHAEAVNIGEHGVRTDFDRHLTAHGHTTARKLADTLKRLGVRVHAVISSPLVRAQQTAAPLVELAPSAAELVTCEELAPDVHKPKKLASAIEALGAGAVIAVGHLPDIATFAGWLIGSGGGGVAFDKGSAALVDVSGRVDEASGTLLWLVHPTWYV